MTNLRLQIVIGDAPHNIYRDIRFHAPISVGY